jgi:hypothetical protein
MIMNIQVSYIDRIEVLCGWLNAHPPKAQEEIRTGLKLRNESILECCVGLLVGRK